MKCPKCGYNSFEHYDNCIKCSSDLTGYKHTYSITSLVLPQVAKENLAAEFLAAESATDEISNTVEAHDDIFSFDLPDDSPSPLRNDDPFNFDEPSAEDTQTTSKKNDDDVFADLLESTSQVDDSPFSAAHPVAEPVKTAVKGADASSGPGEFDLENFSWDESPADTASADSKDINDDFDSLFGDMTDTSHK